MFQVQAKRKKKKIFSYYNLMKRLQSEKLYICIKPNLGLYTKYRG